MFTPMQIPTRSNNTFGIVDLGDTEDLEYDYQDVDYDIYDYDNESEEGDDYGYDREEAGDEIL